MQGPVLFWFATTLTFVVLVTLVGGHPAGIPPHPGQWPASEEPSLYDFTDHPYSPVNIRLDQADINSIVFDLKQPLEGPSHAVAPSAGHLEPWQRLPSVEGSVATPRELLFKDRKSLEKVRRKDRVPRTEPEQLSLLEWSVPPNSKSEEQAAYLRDESEGVRNLINKDIFDNRLIWVDTRGIKDRTWRTFTAGFLQMSRVLPMDFPEAWNVPSHGLIREVRMSVHGGKRGRVKWPQEHPLAAGQDYFNFFGVPDGRKIVRYFGTGYLEASDFDAVNEKVKDARQKIERKAREKTEQKAREELERVASEAARAHI
ncbi:related to Effector family protein Eff1 [Sporisorium scitamineum]|uniref:Related to Effector family protein Eff1 n=1 Tax=Sporisorium scitamineum TaxID=49012 RepID=A0A0F7SBD7_9BASI|nr:related to Effector family protein Eff1 [Sporisorium scitamineum]CDW98038.1 hypothetical protein [Sporisorium scitamineum]